MTGINKELAEIKDKELEKGYVTNQSFIQKLVNKYSNDAELGAKIRNYILKLKKKNYETSNKGSKKK